MAGKILSKFITVDTLAIFLGANYLNSTLETTTATNGYVGNIPYNSIVFIKDLGILWSHGKYFGKKPTAFNISASATSLYWDLTGTGGSNSVSYTLAPYSSKLSTASFYTGTTAPNGDTRLNYNGYLYATAFSGKYLMEEASSWSSSDRTIPFSAKGADTTILYVNNDSNTGLTYNPSTGALKAGSFVKRGGTSSQFLKADGTVDSTTYASTDYVLNTLKVRIFTVTPSFSLSDTDSIGEILSIKASDLADSVENGFLPIIRHDAAGTHAWFIDYRLVAAFASGSLADGIFAFESSGGNESMVFLVQKTENSGENVEITGAATTTLAKDSEVVHSVTSTDNAIVRFDGTSGAIQNSGVTIDDSNNLVTAGNIQGKNIIVRGAYTGNTTRFISSDAVNSIYMSINGSIPAVFEPTCVRPARSNTSANLGDTTTSWNNVYAKKFITNGGTSSQFVKGDGTLDSTTYASTTYVLNAISDSVATLNGALQYVGLYTPTASGTNTAPVIDSSLQSTLGTALKKGYTWIVGSYSSTSNTYFLGTYVEPGDMIIALVDNPGTTIGNYNVILKNLNVKDYLATAGGTMLGPLKWKDNAALPEVTNPLYFLAIDSFASGGTTKWAGLANVKTALGISNLDDTYLKLSSTEQTVASTISSYSKGIVEFYRSSGDHIAFISFANKDSSGNKRSLGAIGFYSGGVGKLQYRDTGGNFYNILHAGNSSVTGGGSTWGSSLTVNINGVEKTLTIPSNPNTNTWRNIYTSGTSRVGTANSTKAINFAAESPLSVSYLAAGTGSGQSGSADYFTIKVSASLNGSGSAGFLPAPPEDTNNNIWMTNTSEMPSWKAVTGNSPTLTWGETVEIGSVGDVVFEVTMPSNPNTDSKVALLNTTTTDYRALLLSYNHGSGTISTGSATLPVYFNTGIYALPSTASLYATKFVTNNGTSVQFVKGDGSLDSNTYLTTIEILDLT